MLVTRTNFKHFKRFIYSSVASNCKLKNSQTSLWIPYLLWAPWKTLKSSLVVNEWDSIVQPFHPPVSITQNAFTGVINTVIVNVNTRSLSISSHYAELTLSSENSAFSRTEIFHAANVMRIRDISIIIVDHERARNLSANHRCHPLFS